MDKADIQDWVKEAVEEALQNSNLIDGPTHLAHHQMIKEFCETLGIVKTASIKVIVTVVFGGLVTLFILGLKHWWSKG